MPRSPPARPPASTPRAAPRRRPDQRLISPAPLRVPLTFLPDEGESEPVPASGTTPWNTLGSSPPVARSFSPARLNAVGAGLPAPWRAGRARLHYVEREDPGDRRPRTASRNSHAPARDLTVRSVTTPRHHHPRP